LPARTLGIDLGKVLFYNAEAKSSCLHIFCDFDLAVNIASGPGKGILRKGEWGEKKNETGKH